MKRTVYRLVRRIGDLMQWATRPMKEKYATYLNDKHEEYCWANLVMWFLGYRSVWSIFFKKHPQWDYDSQLCRPENEGTSYPYCGKCWKHYPELVAEKQKEEAERREPAF